MRVFAVYAIKGGVGKTTSAVNLADLAARSGLRTLLWDLDPQGAASFYLRVKPRVKGGAEKLLRGEHSLKRWLKASDFDLATANGGMIYVDGLNDATAQREFLKLIDGGASDAPSIV